MCQWLYRHTLSMSIIHCLSLRHWSLFELFVGKQQIRMSVWAVLSLSPMVSSVLPVGNHRVFQMFLPGHARLIHTLFEPQNKKTYLRGLPPSTIQTALLSYTDGKTWNFTYRNFKYCYIQVVNTNGADQTARICRQVDTLKFVVRKQQKQVFSWSISANLLHRTLK